MKEEKKRNTILGLILFFGIGYFMSSVVNSISDSNRGPIYMPSTRGDIIIVQGSDIHFEDVVDIQKEVHFTSLTLGRYKY